MKQDLHNVAKVRAKMRKRQQFVETQFMPTEEFVDLAFSPNFINPFPDNLSIYDVYFDLKMN